MAFKAEKETNMYSTLDYVAVAVASLMLILPLSLAPAYGPYVPPGTAGQVNDATTPDTTTAP
jgi:hypothetical protein